MDWTKDQLKAIEARKGTLLVSAAAGSGKTAVLVERVIRRICDPDDPCGVENLLIVTFTNAAAAQMKEKISAAISKKIAEFPQNKHLRRQHLMLPCASICTIDSFCIDLVRQNFHALGIAPDFALLDEGRLKILEEQAMNSVIDRRHDAPTPDFLSLCDLVSGSGDDKKLTESVKKLYTLSRAYPFPEKWLDSLTAEFTSPSPIEDTPWGKTLINHIGQAVETYRRNALHCLSLLSDEPELEVRYAPALQSDITCFERFLAAVSGEKWDNIRSAFYQIEFPTLGPAPGGYDSPVKTVCSNLRNAYKKGIASLGKILCIGSAEHDEDIRSLTPAVTELIALVKDFSAEFSRLKADENGADFSDTLHLALELLAEPDGDGFRRTELARALSENYREILVDEYQDVNEAQDMIFSALSRDGNNLFMVGDVKQSIYRFRQAMPEIFLRRRSGLEEYSDGNYPAKVTLGKNFRSRNGVTETVNFIFSALMSRDAGGLEYDENEYLEAAASYPEKDGADAELYIIEGEKETLDAAQAEFAAKYIADAIAGGLKISDGEGFRDAKYKDFCILLKSVKNNSAPFISALTARGIPVSCEAVDGFLTSPEIMFMISLLKIINNPADDIPLTAVMLSPVFGFTPDDMALIRTSNKSGNIYQCVTSCAAAGNTLCFAFLEKLAGMRRLAATLRTGELVRRLTASCGAVICAGGDTAKKKANLNKFVDIANKTDGKGVAGFVKYIDKLIRSGEDIEGGSSCSEASDSVRIMTIHKSKGLEFPVCILGACEKQYYDRQHSDDLIIAPFCGIGMKTRNGIAKYDTLSRLAASREAKAAEHSEQLRVLYVALTRAKERLVMLTSCEDAESVLSGCAANIRSEKLIDPFSVINFNSYASCIISALLRHPDANDLREKAGLPFKYVLPCKTRLTAAIIPAAAPEEAQTEEKKTAEADEKTVEAIRERAEYAYPYSGLSGIVSKRIASNMDSEEICGEYFASSRPSFMSKDKLTPAQRGTATHKFMQYSDYEKAARSVPEELKRLVENGMLTEAEAEAVDEKAVSEFFKSSLAQRMRNAEKIYKEYAFTASIPLCEMYPEVSEAESRGEVIIVEGVADCAFVENGSLVIVDYKTDRASGASELVDKYREQLRIYKRCLADSIGLPVSETVIYSFRLGCEIKAD